MERFDTIDGVVRDIMSNVGAEEQDYARYLRAANRTLKTLSLYTFDKVKSIEVKVSNQLTAELPDDCIYITKVGTPCCNGINLQLLSKLSTSHRKQDSLSTPCANHSCNDCHPTNANANATNANATCSNLVFFGFVQPSIYGELYGLQPMLNNNYGSYYHDQSANIIVLEGNQNPKIGDTLIIEYRASLDANSYKMIPIEAFDLINAKVLSMLNVNQKQLWDDAAKKAEIRYRRYTSGLTLQDLQRALMR
jgi:hypothetical protein